MGARKKKKMMPIELKREIIEKHEQGVRVKNLARIYGRSTSMICTVLKQKELIKGTTPAKGVTIISKLRNSLHEKMERLLMVWVTEKRLQGGTLTQSIVCEKARAIYGDLLKQIPHTSTNKESKDSFKASRSWFDNFRKRTGIIDQAWLGVTTRTLTSAWKKLWPETIAERTFEGLEPEVSVVEEIVSLGKSMGLEVDERDVNELVEEQSQELTTDELHDLHSQRHILVQRKISFEEEPEMAAVISTRDIKEILGMWERVVEFVYKNHPEKVATGRASELFNETCLTHFRNILKGRKKQTSLDSFFKRSAGENEQNVTKKAKTSDEN